MLRTQGKLLLLLWGVSSLLCSACSCEMASEPSPAETTALSPKQANTLRVSFINVGHGDATLLELPSGETMLIDVGYEQMAKERLLPFLQRNLPQKKIDYLVFTHQHIDHTGGFYRVLNGFTIGEVWTNGLSLNVAQEETLQERHIPQRTPKLGEEILLGGVKLLVVNTFEASRCSSLFWTNDINECSLSMKVSLGDVSVLLPGDLMYKGTYFSVARFGERLKSTILKMPHHGIRQYKLGNFLDAVKPEVAIASASKRDPEPDVLSQYQERSIKTYATRDDGDITFQTNGETYQITTTK